MNKLEFIQTIAPSFQKWGKQYGYKIVSAAIAQACLESGYGTSYKSKWNNILGLKYRPNRITCNNGFFEDTGSEQNPDGTYTPLPSNTAWYSFDSFDSCIHGYYMFLNTSRYAQVKQTDTPLAYLQAIKNAGYATSLSYVQNVYKVVQQWNLTIYDNFEQEKEIKTNSQTNINIIQKISSHNTTLSPNRTIEWIVMHYTAGTTSTRGAAQNTASYFSVTPNQASADFIVDDETIVQYNPDPTKYYCWAVGGNRYSNKMTSLSGQYYGQCRNNNSISIELCSNKINKSSLSVNDDDWYITENTQKMAQQLIRYLIQLYKIDRSHIIMHHQVTGKLCPQPWCKDEQSLTQWHTFFNGIFAGTQTTVTLKPSIPAQDIISGGTQVRYVARVTAEKVNVRSGPGVLYSIVKTVSKGEAFTFVEEQGNFARLLSGAGWVSLSYLEKVDLTQTQPSTIVGKLPYLIRVTASCLNVREGPGMEYNIVRTVSKPSVYTIVEEKDNWGLLKAYASNRNGWISLKYTERYNQ